MKVVAPRYSLLCNKSVCDRLHQLAEKKLREIVSWINTTGFYTALVKMNGPESTASIVLAA